MPEPDRKEFKQCCDMLRKACDKLVELNGPVHMCDEYAVHRIELYVENLEKHAISLDVPIPMVLHCPNCHKQHIDEPEERCDSESCFEGGKVGVWRCGLKKDHKESHDYLSDFKFWTNHPHKSHLCAFCKTIWRPAAVYTTGVAEVERGKNDTWPPEDFVASGKLMVDANSLHGGGLHKANSLCIQAKCKPAVNRLPAGKQLQLEAIKETGMVWSPDWSGAVVLIWCGQRDAFWRTHASGYTDDRAQAGVWLFEEAYELTKNCGAEKQIVYQVAELP